MPSIINTRADLDTLKGTPAYGAAMERLKASMITHVDAAIYPDGYGQPGYSGPAVDPQWHDIETLDTIERLGFTKAEFLADYAAISGQ